MLAIILSFAAIKEQLHNLKTLMGLKGQDTQAFNKSKENEQLCTATWQGQKPLSAEPYDQGY